MKLRNQSCQLILGHYSLPIVVCLYLSGGTNFLSHKKIQYVISISLKKRVNTWFLLI